MEDFLCLANKQHKLLLGWEITYFATLWTEVGEDEAS